MRWNVVRASVASAMIAFWFPVSAEPVRMDTIDDELKVLIERSVSERFLDPWSTQFGRLSANLDLAKGTIVTCGMVNAKNNMGGYVGFKPFFAIWSFGNGMEYVATADESGEDFVREKCERDDLELTVWP